MAGQMRWSAPPMERSSDCGASPTARDRPGGIPVPARGGTAPAGPRLRLGIGELRQCCGSAGRVLGPAERMLRRLPRVDSLVMCIASLRSRM